MAHALRRKFLLLRCMANLLRRGVPCSNAVLLRTSLTLSSAFSFILSQCLAVLEACAVAAGGPSAHFFLRQKVWPTVMMNLLSYNLVPVALVVALVLQAGGHSPTAKLTTELLALKLEPVTSGNARMRHRPSPE